MADSDTNYYLERAEQEAVRAIQTDHPKAAAAHRGLAVGYSARAVIAIVNEQDGPKERVRHRGLVATMRAAPRQDRQVAAFSTVQFGQHPRDQAWTGGRVFRVLGEEKPLRLQSDAGFSLGLGR